MLSLQLGRDLRGRDDVLSAGESRQRVDWILRLGTDSRSDDATETGRRYMTLT